MITIVKSINSINLIYINIMLFKLFFDYKHLMKQILINIRLS